MIHLQRPPEPEILVRKKSEWLTIFLASGKDRPSNSTYGHAEILSDLISISHKKCYYCERKLTGIPKEIDHYIEIACDKSKAFDWENLFLSCENCNNKIAHNRMPVNESLNPFIQTDAEIEEHISFEDEIIRIKNNSQIGSNTIKKFKLDSERIEFIRVKFLKDFYKNLSGINERCKLENRDFSEAEKEDLRRYSYPDYPFSLMFRIILREKKLL